MAFDASYGGCCGDLFGAPWDCLRAAEPDIAEKVRWFNLGIEPFVPRDHGSQGDVIRVAVSGGTRPIKGNEVVARAVSVLRQQGHRVELLVFGRAYADNPQLEGALRVCDGRMAGQVSQRAFLDTLSGIDVFVMNSRRESFGMSTIDALAGGVPSCFAQLRRYGRFSARGRGHRLRLRRRERGRARSCTLYRIPTPSVCMMLWTLTRWVGMWRRNDSVMLVAGP